MYFVLLYFYVLGTGYWLRGYVVLTWCLRGAHVPSWAETNFSAFSVRTETEKQGRLGPCRPEKAEYRPDP